MSTPEGRWPWLVGVIAILAVAAIAITIAVLLGQRAQRNAEIREKLAVTCIQNGGLWLDGAGSSGTGTRGCLR